MFVFGKRRVMRMGKYTRVVSLPRDWLRNVGIGDCGEVSFAMDTEGRLIVTPAQGVSLGRTPRAALESKQQEYGRGTAANEDPSRDPDAHAMEASR